MNSFNPKDFEEILDLIKGKIGTWVECDGIRPIESNFNTKSMMFRTKNSDKEGMIIVGEDKEFIAVDISVIDGDVRSFILKDKNDVGAINNIVGWFEENYMLEKSLKY
ncbi:hypothetical protein CPJCM30710_27400 [Clostridium polyendosporum]|uniref:Uncharacterized protein n=1 Tax=Clostridium polyendosporum TaxID=69208 RepID=A0A919VFA5_9CLOT|nr:hypothetical protein [Clostridium polyendosporum]GIM30074.1 hypothetical protein CPJCM30710_27400 [Clostridium polyendosporum]